MKITLLHTADALEPPVDPVLDQLTRRLRALGHEVDRAGRSTAMSRRSSPRCRARSPDLVFNLAESFGGKSALESNVAALLNLLGLRYTGSSPAGLLIAGRQEPDEEDSALSRDSDAAVRDAVSRRAWTGRAI